MAHLMVVVASVVVHEPLELARFTVFLYYTPFYLRQTVVELVYRLVAITPDGKLASNKVRNMATERDDN